MQEISLSLSLPLSLSLSLSLSPLSLPVVLSLYSLRFSHMFPGGVLISAFILTPAASDFAVRR